MLTKMKDIFRLPSSPFSLGKTSFKPVTAKPIKIPARRLSAASHEGLAKPFLREETATDDNDELVEESEEDEANGSDQNEQVERENEEDFSEEERGDEMNSPQERVQLTESPLVEASEDEDLESSIVPRQTSHDISGEALVTIPPPTTQARKRRLSIQNGENTGKRKKSRKSELAKGKPTIADTDEEDATPSQALSKRERKEARRRKREQKAERKMARDSTVAASQDLKSVHSVKNQTTVVAAPKSIKSRGKSGLEIPSSPEQPSLRQVSPELSSITEKTQAENSSKKHKKATLETPNEAEQLNPSPETQEPTPEQTHQDPKTSKKPAKKPKTSRKTPTSIDRTPTTPRSFTRSSLSAIRIVDSSASEDELSNPSPLPTSTILPTPKPRRRKVGDLVHLQSPEIGDRKQTPSDGKQTPSKVKKFSPEEDGRLRHIIKQYKEVVIPKM
jgi:hypothetical protein